MPTEQLTIGPEHTILAGVVYALPPRKVRIHASSTAEISVNGTAWDVLTAVEGIGAEAASNFIRCSTNATMVLKAS